MHPLRAVLDWSAARAREWDRFWFQPIDPTTLGLLRILVGGMLIYTHVVWGLRLEELFGSRGWMPPALMEQAYEEQFLPSFWWYVPDADLRTAHWICLGVLVLFTLGVATPVTGLLAFAITVSYAYRARMANYGLDQINALLTLYLALGPAGATLSVDRLIRRLVRGEASVAHSSRAMMSLRLIQVHYCIIYVWAGLAKLQGIGWWTGLSFWLAVANQEYQSRDLTWLAWHPGLVNVLTHVTIFWELTFWALVFRPGWRLPMIAVGIGLHLGIGAFMGMWTFCWIMIFGYLAFVPDLVTRLARFGRDPSRARPVLTALAVPILLIFSGCVEPDGTPDIVHERGRLMLVRNQPREAIEAFERVLEIRPDDPSLHFDLGVAWSRLGEREKAVQAYGEVLRRNPEFVRAYVNRADELNQLGRFAEAAQDCTAAMELDPVDPLAWQNRTVAHRGLGLLNRAEADLDVALALAPDHPRARLLQAELHLDRDAPREALEGFSQVIEHLKREPSRRIITPAPDTRELLARSFTGRAAAWNRLGETERSRADLEMARTIEHDREQ